MEVGYDIPPLPIPGGYTVLDPDTSGLTELGKTGSKANRNLETFPTPAGVTSVQFSTDEFTSLCPLTGQPDYCSIVITFTPGARCLESKSLKLYLMTFRNEGHFCEALSAIIAHDLQEALNARSLCVEVKQTPRGGIALAATTILRGRDGV